MASATSISRSRAAGRGTAATEGESFGAGAFGAAGPDARLYGRRVERSHTAWMVLPMLFCLVFSTCASDYAAFAAAARAAFLKAKTNYQANPDNPEVTWKFASAAFDYGDFATNNSQRAALANEGIAACKKAMERATNSAQLHYYLALNLGQLARTKSLGALKLVGQMEREFNAAKVLDEHLDHAGPDRGLGLLYRDAPSFGSIGSRSKARAHLLRTVELEPDYPENRLVLAESWARWGDRAAALEQVKALEKIWDAAKVKFSGEAWAPDWEDWSSRLQKLKTRLEAEGKS